MTVMVAVTIELLVSGFIHGMRRLPSGGAALGDVIAFPVDAIVYECEPRDTWREFWFADATTKRCIKAKADRYSTDKIVDAFPAGTRARVTGIKSMNGMDSLVRVVYLRVDGTDGTLIVYDFHLEKLLASTPGG
jgi:hypothetical protein